MSKYIVIGAGILGASTAYHLAKSGEQVTIVDRKDSGQATDAAAGIICPWISQRRNKAWYALAKGGAAYYSKLIPQLEEDGERKTGYQKVGAIHIHSDIEKLKKVKERALLRREEAPEIGEITLLTKDDTLAKFPPLSEEYSSLYIGGAARVNGRYLRDALLNGAKRHGARIVNSSASIRVEGEKIKGVSTESELIDGEQVIVTAGAWANQLMAQLGMEMLVSFQKAQIVHLKLSNIETSTWPVVMPPNDQYILAFENGEIIIGATHENVSTFDNRVTVGGLHEVFEKGLKIAPGLQDASFMETRVGFRPFTPNFLPVIGEVPGFEGLYFANGLGASGLTVGPFLGDQLAKLASGKKVDIDLGLYDVSLAIKK